MSVKSPFVGKRKRAAMRQDQTDTMKSSSQGRGRTSEPGQECFGHRRRWHFGKDPRHRATRKSVVSIRTKAHSQTHGARVIKLAADWTYDVVSIGYPGPVLGGRPSAEPVNLGRGWIAFDFAQAFGRPVKVMNDAAMQALGSYEGGKMLFLGSGNRTRHCLDRRRRGEVRWSSAICRTRKAPTRITSDVPAWSATVRRSGGVMWPTSLSGS